MESFFVKRVTRDKQGPKAAEFLKAETVVSLLNTVLYTPSGRAHPSRRHSMPIVDFACRCPIHGYWTDYRHVGLPL